MAGFQCVRDALRRWSHPTAELSSRCTSGFGLDEVVRNLDNTLSADDAQRREDQVPRRDGRPEVEQYRRPTSEFRG